MVSESSACRALSEADNESSPTLHKRPISLHGSPNMPLPGRSISVHCGRAWILSGAIGFLLSAALGVALGWFPGWAGSLGPGAAFRVERARADLARFLADGAPRVAGTPAAGAARDRLEAQLRELGLEVRRAAARVERRAGAVDLENLTALVPGRTPGDARVALVAHSDSAPGSPGASDDGAGVACLVEVARCLREAPPERSVLLVFTDGEERGLLGAQAFVANDPDARALRAVVNLDARGACGPAFVFETGPETAWLSGVLAGIPGVRSNSLMGAVYGAMPNGTDFTVFRRAGVSGFNVAFIGDVGAYHAPDDTQARQSVQSLAHMGTVALAMVRTLDRDLPPGGVPPGAAVYGDVLGLVVVRWPDGWTLPMAVVALLVAGLGIAPARRGIAGMAAALGVLAVSAGLGWLLGAIAGMGGLTMANAPGRLAALDAALFGTAALATVAAGVVLARRGVDVASATAGAWAPWAALAVGSAVALPAVSFPFVLPVTVLAAGLLLLLPWRSSGDARLLPASFAAAMAAGALLLPLEPAFLDALGFQPGWLNGLRAGIVSVTLLPLAAGAARSGVDPATQAARDHLRG